jgi:alkylation response protein AidB-like acyl-CoA dehydrogenase
VAEGTALLTLAVRPATAGLATLVPGGAVGDAVLVLDADSGDLVLVPLQPSGSAIDNLASSPLADIATTGTDRVVLASGDAAATAYAVALDEWRALTACWLGGLSRAALGLGVQYAKDRRQFGVPIGSFQALQHRMADMVVEHEQSKSMEVLAALSADLDDATERRRVISAAKVQIGKSGRFVGQQSIQLHGGIGMTDEYVAGHYFKRLTMIDQTFGDADHHLDRFAEVTLPVG